MTVVPQLFCPKPIAHFAAKAGGTLGVGRKREGLRPESVGGYSGGMTYVLLVSPLIASLRDLVPWIPIVVIIVVLSALGVVVKDPHGNHRDSDDD